MENEVGTLKLTYGRALTQVGSRLCSTGLALVLFHGSEISRTWSHYNISLENTQPVTPPLYGGGRRLVSVGRPVSSSCNSGK